jgi:hypothetical protein
MYSQKSMLDPILYTYKEKFMSENNIDLVRKYGHTFYKGPRSAYVVKQYYNTSFDKNKPITQKNPKYVFTILNHILRSGRTWTTITKESLVTLPDSIMPYLMQIDDNDLNRYLPFYPDPRNLEVVGLKKENHVLVIDLISATVITSYYIKDEAAQTIRGLNIEQGTCMLVDNDCTTLSYRKMEFDNSAQYLERVRLEKRLTAEKLKNQIVDQKEVQVTENM